MKPNYKHGMHNTLAYRRWIYMKSRCKRDPLYISNGITVCAEWEHDFMKFYEDMGEPPAGYTLDRIDGTLGYSAGNCRWANYRTQNRNLSTNRRLGGKLLCEVAEATGLSHTTLQYRAAKGLDLRAPRISERTHCKAGHEWTEGNTYYTTVRTRNGGYRTGRYCRKCRAIAQANLRKRKADLEDLKGLNNKGGIIK